MLHFNEREKKIHSMRQVSYNNLLKQKYYKHK